MGVTLMFFFWQCYYASKFWANYRHALVGMPQDTHRALMRMVYPF
jgi:hypothetical protein